MTDIDTTEIKGMLVTRVLRQAGWRANLEFCAFI